MNEEKYIGYLKYSGKLVEEGLMDARKSANALLGFDEAVRFFVGHQAPELIKNDFDFPVRIKQGSWEALIPDTIGTWVQMGLGIAATAYLTTAANKMAEKDFNDVGIKDVFSKSIMAIQWVIRIGKHIGDLTQKNFVNLKWKNNNTEIGIPNSEEKYLFVPKEFLDLYSASSPKLLVKIADLIEDQRTLSIGVYKDGKAEEESIPRRFKHVFTLEEKEGDDILFPELVHGQNAVLEGAVTRGNEESNTVGFKYRGHILTCDPAEGSIVRFKPALFLNSRIHGVINRQDVKGGYNAKRPRITFTNIESLESDTKNMSLFSEA